MTMLIDMLKHCSFSSDIRVRIKSSFLGYSWKSEALSGKSTRRICRMMRRGGVLRNAMEFEEGLKSRWTVSGSVLVLRD